MERWFAELTRKHLRRGVHTSTAQLEADIREPPAAIMTAKSSRFEIEVGPGLIEHRARKFSKISSFDFLPLQDLSQRKAFVMELLALFI